MNNTSLKHRFAEATPEFARFLEQRLRLTELEQAGKIALRGRVDINGFEYFGISYGRLKLDIPNFSKNLAVMPANTDVQLALPAKLTQAQQTTIQAINSVYTSAFHGLRHEPIGVGAVPVEAFNKAAMPNCSDMPIRLANDTFRLPAEYQPLAGIIKAIDDIDRQVTPYHDQFCVALTVDTRDQPANESQRSGGAHTDGFQGTRVNPKTIGEHSYIFAWPNYTMFSTAAYPELINLDPDVYNLFEAMQTLTYEVENGRRGKEMIKPKAGTVSLFDCYTVHDAPKNLLPVPLPRKFLRLTYTVRLFDRLGNSVNPHLPLAEYNLRDTPANLRKPSLRKLGR